MQVLLTECYEIVTEQGTVTARGIITEHEPVSVREAVAKLRECSQLSVWPIRTASDCRGVWAESESQQDYRTGDYERRSVHLRSQHGELTGRQMARLLRAAGLVSIRL